MAAVEAGDPVLVEDPAGRAARAPADNLALAVSNREGDRADGGGVVRDRAWYGPAATPGRVRRRARGAGAECTDRARRGCRDGEPRHRTSEHSVDLTISVRRSAFALLRGTARLRSAR